MHRSRKAFLPSLLLVVGCGSAAWAAPYVPPTDAQVLAELPAGSRHANDPSRALAASRLDVALPLAQFDIGRARDTGDLRFLGYAEAVLSPWLRQANVAPQVLILDATIRQSRHDFAGSLTDLDRALASRPDDAQAWLTRATVLRVLGRFAEASAACEHLAAAADASIVTLCRQSLRGLTGHLREAYAIVVALSEQELAPQARAWRLSELGEMAERLGDDAAAEHWLHEGVQAAPQDAYLRTAYADLLLRHGRGAETLQLLAGHESLEPMLLRVALAHGQLQDGAGAQAETLLANAFEVEERRGDAVHRREQARFLLDIRKQPAAALRAAQDNWRVQHEPDDMLILLRAAHAAQQPHAADDVRSFLTSNALEDVRLDPYRSAT